MIRFRTLGGIGLTSGTDQELRAALAHPRKMALLAYLVASPATNSHSRDSLLGLFWPEQDQPHARAALRQAIHVIRRLLGPDIVLAYGDEQIEIERRLLWCDACALEEHVLCGQHEEALDLFKGDFLNGFFISGAPEFDRWLETRRAQFRDAATMAAWSLVQRDAACGDARGVVLWGGRLLQVAPYDENALRHLVGALDRVGDRAGALRVFERFERRIAEDFGIAPSAPTHDLIGAIRAHAS